MNTNVGIIGKKLGNTQVFGDDGQVTRVTAVLAGPCVLLTKRTLEKDGYTALQVGFGRKATKALNRPQLGYYKKLGVEAPEVVREFRVTADVLDKYEVGQALSVTDLFREGQFVDVSGITRGRGFTGVMRRHNFSGSASSTHGSHEYKRHGGSIGTNMTPGRTFKNKRMPGHYGAEKQTIQNLRVVKILSEENLVLIEGAVPGPRNGVVTVRGAVKKRLVAN